MYNLLIVEDETFTREGLLKHISWRTLGIKEIRVAANGRDALELMKDFHPDIVLTDIKMPHMNGIEMSANIREKDTDCRIIFFSGYADKEYLLSAITLKADGFIEKPVEIKKVIAAVSNAVSQLNKTRKTNAKISNLQKDSLPLMQRGMLADLLSKDFNWTTFEDKYIPAYFTWSQLGNYYITNIKMFMQQNDLDINPIISEINEYFTKDAPVLVKNYYIDSLKTNQLALLFRIDNVSEVVRALQNLQQHLYQKHCIETTIGISSCCKDLSYLHVFFKLVFDAVEYQYFYHCRHCLFECSTPLKEYPAPLEIFNKEEFNLSGIEHLFQILLAEKYTNLSQIRHQLYEYYTLMMERTMNNQTIAWEQFKQLTLNEYIDLIGYGMKAYQILGNNTYDIKIKNAVHYILWNYPKKELDIQMLSEHVDLSPNYLCSLFKKQTGSTINDFIIKVRLDKARVLLEKTNLKLYEITERVGLQDANYFSSLFKEEYGMPPSVYRRNLKP